jgi:hypothetical protein
MSRYVDADALMQNIPNEEMIAKMAVAHAPSIDIVRCKECKHWIGETEYYEDREYKACWQLCGQYMDSEFWCKYGEREGE